jgi:uncharacterized membrane-anchored protein
MPVTPSRLAPTISSSKVPNVDIMFWLLKLLTTALGESISDALIKQYNPVPVVLVTAVVFVVILMWQLRQSSYRTAPYWSSVVMVGIFGTMVADSVHVALGVPYVVSATTFAIALIAVFVLWSRVERTLSIHSITTSRRELFYWAAIISTFALGTAVGDLTATTLRFGYLASGLAFLVAFALPGIAFRFRMLSAIPAFWTSYVLTRPLGASFADYMGKPISAGGVGWGSARVAVGLAVLFAVGVAIQRKRELRVA